MTSVGSTETGARGAKDSKEWETLMGPTTWTMANANRSLRSRRTFASSQRTGRNLLPSRPAVAEARPCTPVNLSKWNEEAGQPNPVQSAADSEESSGSPASSVMDSPSDPLGLPPKLERKSRVPIPAATSLARTQTLPASLQGAKAPRFTRSFSLSAGSPGPSTPGDNFTIFQRSLSDFRFAEENANPNRDVVGEMDETMRERKKFRGRRASAQGSIPSLSEMGAKFLQQQSREALFTRDLTSPTPPNDGGSPSSRTSSTRKRGVCGSPLFSDMDESIGALSASMNSVNSTLSTRRSRSRIFFSSTNHAPQTPCDPAVISAPTPSIGLMPRRSSQFEPESPHSRRRKLRSSQTSVIPPTSGCRGMDTADTDDDDDSNHMDTAIQDSSFTLVEDSHDVPVVTIPTQNVSECLGKKDVFSTMSSYEDLKFLIDALRKEKSNPRKTFGIASWTVIVPKEWKSQRRLAFACWTTNFLNFTIRSLGNGVKILQISASKGHDVLDLLEESLATYDEQTSTLSLGSKLKADPLGLLSMHAEGPAILPLRQSYGTPSPVVPACDATMDDGTVELTSAIQGLSMQESASRCGRPSDASSAYSCALDFGGVSRPSFENSVGGTTDFFLHLHGHESPENDDVIHRRSKHPRPGRGSSTGTNMSILQAPICNMEVMETPQIKPDEGWGSNPVPGRDWGLSYQCDNDILEVLQDRFDEACRAAGARDSFGGSVGLPIMPGGLDFDEPVPSRPCELSHYSMSEELVEDMNSSVLDEGQRIVRRRQNSVAKRNRMSLWAAASNDRQVLPANRKSAFARSSNLGVVNEFAMSLHEMEIQFPVRRAQPETIPDVCPVREVESDEKLFAHILSFLAERDLLCTASLVSTAWASAATSAHSALMLASVGYRDEESDEESNKDPVGGTVCIERDWKYITSQFPWGCFLSSGAFKEVFKVYNISYGAEEAISIMDVEAIEDKRTIASELVVSSLLSSMARRGICPNFVKLHGVFTSSYMLPESHWGSEENRKPKGSVFDPQQTYRRPRQPKKAFPRRFQFMRMELCSEGDAEEFLKRQPNECLEVSVAQSALFQVAFALHAAADRFSLKHYDIKLLNVFMQKVEAETPNVVLRYGLGCRTFAIRHPCEETYFAKLADYGTANIKAESTGAPVTIAQFTTLENTPPEFLILGDDATQGHGHDNWGLGLCMLHLFTGHAPYEEILLDVKCPHILKKKLRSIWENENETGYSVIRSVILSDVYKDERGHIIEGEPDETLYDTLYKFLVLFGIPTDKYEQKQYPAVWKAIADALEPKATKNGRTKKQGTDVMQYENDCSKYSVQRGTNCYIRRARERLTMVEGGIELLFNLCDFNPTTRATALQVLNSKFMDRFREPSGTQYRDDETVYSFTAFSTHR